MTQESEQLEPTKDSQTNITGGRDANLDVGGDFVSGNKRSETKVGTGAAAAGDGSTAVGQDGKNVQHVSGSTVIIGDGNVIGSQPALKWEDELQRQTRQNLIGAVRYTWIDSILKPAVENEMYIELGMVQDRTAVAQPVQTMLPTQEPIPEGRTLRQIFDAHQRKLLILGEPASGKTISLLRLAEELLVLAEQDTKQPVPVVLNLSSWANRRTDLLTWLGEALFSVYKMAREEGRLWVKERRLILLLDGLDEVAEEHRNECLTVINAFQADYAVAMVVCSRIGDYGALQEQLELATAVLIEKLNPTQIDGYLQKFGGTAVGIRQAVAENMVIRELAESPLMLSLLPLAYADLSSGDIGQAETVVEGRERLFATYVQKVFERKKLKGKSYKIEHALHWLSFVAGGLQTHEQTIFYIEELDLPWIPFKRARLWPKLLVGLVVGLVFGMLGGLVGGLVVGLVFGMLGGLVFGMLGGLLGEVSISEKQTFTPPSRSEWLQVGKKVLLGGLVGGLSGGLVFGMLGGLVFGMLGGMVGGLSGGLIFGLIFGLSVGLLAGLLNELYEIERLPNERLEPNQMLLKTRSDELIYGVLAGVLAGVIGGLIFGLSVGLLAGLIFGLSVGLSVGLQTPLINGVVHYSSRVVLARQGLLPFVSWAIRQKKRDASLIGFLDDMRDRWLLQRVGAGWVFRHRYLLEYFAEKCPVEFEPMPEQKPARWWEFWRRL